VVLCVGGIHPVKNQLLLVEALRDTEDHLVLLGPVRDREYAAQVRALAGGNVTFIDAVQDPRPFFRRADLLVLPSLSESAPNVVLEAMAYGCSVVASAVGDVPVMLDQGRLGRLVEPGNVRALRTAIADPICGEDGPAWVQKEYSVEAMVGHVESLYSQVLS
jgi:glycosyltransferase involved in cell wall biosynthesis